MNHMNQHSHQLSKRYQSILDDIHDAEQNHQRVNDSVNLVAVSKTKPIEDIKALYHLGQLAFGENYLQEAVEKIDALQETTIEWHFIGHIQSNKTALIAEKFDWVHGVDRLKIAKRLANQRPNHMPPLNIFLQVNIENEPSKSGFTESQLLDELSQLHDLPNLIIHGLMAIPKAHPDIASQRAVFNQVKKLNELCQQTIPSMTQLSMGMSNDMDSAIAEGATHIRVGSAIFGERNY